METNKGSTQNKGKEVGKENKERKEKEDKKKEHGNSKKRSQITKSPRGVSPYLMGSLHIMSQARGLSSSGFFKG